MIKKPVRVTRLGRRGTFQFIALSIIFIAVFHAPTPSAFLGWWPDTLRPESLVILVAGAVLVARSGLPKVLESLFVAFAVTIVAVFISVFWSYFILSVPFDIRDFADVFILLVNFFTLLLAYKFAARFGNIYLKVLLILVVSSLIIQLGVTVAQMLGVEAVIKVSNLWWSKDYLGNNSLLMSRPPGTTANSIALGTIAGLMSVFMHGMGAGNTWRLRMIGAIGLITAIIIVVLTKSRTGLVTIVVANVIYLLLIMRAPGWQRKLTSGTFRIFVVGALFLIVGFVFTLTLPADSRANSILLDSAIRLQQRVDNSLTYGLQEQEGGIGRVNDAVLVLNQISESPLFGMGPEQSLGRSWFHSSYFTLLWRYGWVGTIAYLGLYFIAFLLMWQGYKKKSTLLLSATAFSVIFGVLLAGIAQYTFIGDRQVAFWIWLIVGTILGMTRHLRVKDAETGITL